MGRTQQRSCWICRRFAPDNTQYDMTRSIISLGKAAALDPRKELRSLHSCAEQPDRQDFAKSSLPACPVLLRCRSACKRFLPDLLRRTASSWCALVVAALLRKSIVACSRSCCCQGTVWFCKKLWTFQNAKGFVSESSPYTLYKLNRVFLNGGLMKIQGIFTFSNNLLYL